MLYAAPRSYFRATSASAASDPARSPRANFAIANEYKRYVSCGSAAARASAASAFSRPPSSSSTIPR
jgi:hypothetical protein